MKLNHSTKNMKWKQLRRKDQEFKNMSTTSALTITSCKTFKKDWSKGSSNRKRVKLMENWRYLDVLNRWFLKIKLQNNNHNSKRSKGDEVNELQDTNKIKKKWTIHQSNKIILSQRKKQLQLDLVLSITMNHMITRKHPY